MHPKELLPSRLAEVMKMTEGHLWCLSENFDRHYWPTRPRPVGKKIRELDVPKPFLKKQLRALHRFLARDFHPHGIVHGGASGKSCVTSATVHCGRKYMISRDIKDCYPSISPEALHVKLLKYGFSVATALLLSRLLTVRGHIPQGSPVSGDALNLFLHDGDVALGSFAGRRGTKLSRTYDDIIASVDVPDKISEVEDAIEAQIIGHDLAVNQKKKAEAGFQIHGNRPKVHNLVVEDRRGVGLPDDQARRAISLAEVYRRSAKVVSAGSLASVATKRAEIHGWMHYCRQIRFSPAAQIRRLMEAGDRYVARRLKRVGLGSETRQWWLQTERRNEPARIAKLWQRNCLLRAGVRTMGGALG